MGLALMTLLMAAACEPSGLDIVTSLARDFPTIERLQVTGLSQNVTDPVCYEFTYARGQFVTDTSSDSCARFLSGGNRPSSLDAQATKDLDDLLAESKRNGQELEAFTVEFGPDGKVASGWFWVVGHDEGGNDYVYDPGRAKEAVAQPRSGCASALSTDWYREWDC
jgi:hypothetical protein